MGKTLLLCSAALYLGATLPCVAQHLNGLAEAPAIELSTAEAAQAKQLAQDLKNARERNDKARAAWQAFYQTYQAAHTDLPSLLFTSDLRLAYIAPSNPSNEDMRLIEAVELTAGERSKAEALHREFVESWQAMNQADRNWKEYQYQLVMDHHIPIAPGWGSVSVTLSTGKTVSIPKPWDFGLAFMPDFRFAVPRGY